MRTINEDYYLITNDNRNVLVVFLSIVIRKHNILNEICR